LKTVEAQLDPSITIGALGKLVTRGRGQWVNGFYKILRWGPV
jgi:hypothetical protein